MAIDDEDDLQVMTNDPPTFSVTSNARRSGGGGSVIPTNSQQ